jgi:hypothetical protein
MRIPTPSPPLVTPGRTAHSDSEKAEALADSLESQFQPVNDPSDPAVTEKVTEALQAYSYAPASEPKLTNPMEVQDAIRDLKVGKAPGPNRLTNRALNAPSSAGYKPLRGDIQRSASSAVLPTSMETRPRDFHPETWEGPVTTLVVSAY